VAPLVWDEAEQAYHLFFLSCDGKTKNNFWLSEPTSDRARIAFKRKEKKKKDNMKRRKEEEDCADNQRRLHRTKGSFATTMRRD
jgi:hypothetical protein